MEDDGFVFVKKKKSSKRKKFKSLNYDIPQTPVVDLLKANRAIEEAKLSLVSSPVFNRIVLKIEEIQKVSKLKFCSSIKIVSYGLGHLSYCRISQWQTALLSALKDKFDAIVEVYDPVFSSSDCELLINLNFIYLGHNEEGKRQISELTLFYMPHCGKALYNNLLYINWKREKLMNLIIIGNSFQNIIQSITSKDLEKYYKYIKKSDSLCEEDEICDLVSDNDIFNDMSIIYFPQYNLKDMPQTEWDFTEMPVYKEIELEIIRNN